MRDADDVMAEEEMTEDRDDTAASGEEGERPKLKEKEKDRKAKNKPLTKIVIRRLPPSMTEESFLEQVSPIPEHDYFYFAQPDPSLGLSGFSRAYINFINVDDIYLFRDKFDGYIFLDDKGAEYVGIVEYAPFQRVPKMRKKKDPKCGTIESDPDYEKFLESLREPEGERNEPKLEYSYPIGDGNDKKNTSTPLLEYLALRKADKRGREERRRRDADKRKVRDRKGQPAIQEEEVQDSEAKKIKPREWEKDKSSPKNKDEDDYKDTKGLKPSRSFKERRDDRKKLEGDKKEYNKNDDKYRKEKRDKVREIFKEPQRDKPKEIKKYSEARKERIENEKSDTKKRENEEKTETHKPHKIRDSDIKPFTQLPQVKTDDLTKVLEEMDRMKLEQEAKKKKDFSSGDIAVKDKIRRKSLDSTGSAKEDEPKRQNSFEDNRKSTDRDSSLEKDKSNGSGDPRTERRIRNKDRPSMVIYQPGMGRFSKQRMAKEKEGTETEPEAAEKKDT